MHPGQIRNQVENIVNDFGVALALVGRTIGAKRFGRLQGKIDFLDRHPALAVRCRHIGIHLGDDYFRAVDKVLIDTDRNTQTDRSVLVGRRNLGHDNIRLDDAVLVHNAGDLAEPHGGKADLAWVVFFEQTPQLGRSLPGHIAKIRSQSLVQKGIRSKRQPGIHGQVAEALDLVPESRIEGRRFDTAMGENRDTPVGDGSDGFVRGDNFHGSLSPSGGDFVFDPLATLHPLKR